jgi:hypothetical protein
MGGQDPLARALIRILPQGYPRMLQVLACATPRRLSPLSPLACLGA